MLRTEIISGGQRVHDPNQLIDNLIEAGIHPDSMRDCASRRSRCR